MHGFKKIFLQGISLILIVILLSVALIEIGARANLYSYCDKDIRDDLSGEINYIFNGASHLQMGINTSVVDKELDCCSYNLSGSAISWSGRYALFEEEIDRNPVDTVVIELSYNTFSREDKLEGDLKIFPRIGTTSRRIKFFFENANLSSFGDYYDNLLLDGFSGIKKELFNITIGQEIESENKGTLLSESVNVTLDNSAIIKSYNSDNLSLDFKSENLKYLSKMVNKCKEKDVNVIFMIIPVSDNMIWCFSEWNEFYSKISELCNSYGYPLIDFNLYKDRYSLFNDETSFHDTQHMSAEGGLVFSELYCDIMKKINAGEDVSNLFYSSYDEMKADSPYMEYYLAHMNDTE